MNFRLLPIAALLFTLSVLRGQAQVAPPAGDVPPTGVYKVGGDVTPPRLIHSVNPHFPFGTGLHHVEGTCTVRMVVDEKGVPQNVKVFKSIGEKLPPNKKQYAAAIDQSVVEAVQQYRFDPSLLHGKPVAVEVKTEFNLKVQ